ncbi:MAG: glycerate kinase, partial [Clostridia bacterium]|nr:glycerate kinase [Clostridia bacterium]
AAYVLEIVGLEEAARDADLVVTGEGKTDVQTATGKLPLAVAMAAKRVNPGVKTVCLCAVDESTRELYERGTDAVFALADRPMAAEESMRRAAELIVKAAYNMTGLL